MVPQLLMVAHWIYKIPIVKILDSTSNTHFRNSKISPISSSFPSYTEQLSQFPSTTVQTSSSSPPKTSPFPRTRRTFNTFANRITYLETQNLYIIRRKISSDASRGQARGKSSFVKLGHLGSPYIASTWILMADMVGLSI